MKDVSTKKSKGLLFAGIAVVVLVALYAVLGFWVAPKFVQSRGTKLIAEKTGLNLTFANVRLNPFTFTAVFEDLSLGQAAEEPFLTMAEFYTDFDVWSLLARPYRFRLIRMVSAEERLNILPDGRFDFAPLLETIAEQVKNSGGGGVLPEVLVERWVVESARITVTDPVRSKTPVITIYPVNGEFTDLGTAKGHIASYDLRGTIVDIGSIRDSGKVSLDPLRIDGHYEAGPFKLPPLWALTGDRFRFDILNGSIRMDVTYTAELKSDGYAFEIRGGELALEDLKLNDKDQAFTFGSLSEMTVRGLRVNISEKTASLEEVEVSGADLTLWLRPDGESGILDVLTMNTSRDPEAQTKRRNKGLPAFIDGWQARLEKATILETLLRFEDQRSEPAITADVVSMPSFTLAGVSVDTGTKRLDIQEVVASEMHASGWLNPDGTIGLSQVLGLTSSVSTADSEPSTALNGRSVTGGWQAQLNRAELRDATIVYEDRTLKTPMKLAVYPVTGKVSGFSYPQGMPASVSLDIVGEGGGVLAVSGAAGIQPLNADLNVSLNRFPLEKLQAIADTASRLKIASGSLDVIGRVAAPGGTDGPKFRFDGELMVSEMELLDTGTGKPILRQTELQINGIRLDVAPNRLFAAEVVDRRPYVHLVIEEDGSTNLENALKLEDENVQAIGRSVLGQMVDAILLQIQGPMPIRVDSAGIEEGTVLVTHKLPRGAFDMKADQIFGRLGNIDTDSDNMVDVELRGRIDDKAPFEAKGRVDPFGDEVGTEMTISLKNYNLVNANPYAKQYVGYGVNRGKVRVDLDYSVTNNYVTGKNEFFIRRLELGEKTDSPDAVDVPVEMGVALLKDRQGNIHLKVPVEGDTKDPNFRIESVVASTMVGMVGAVVTSPFRLLGGIAGTASPDELRMVNFSPGADDLDEAEKQKLSKLATGFQERPGVGMEIMGTASPKVDRASIARERLQKKVRKDLIAGQKAGDVTGDAGMTDEKMHRVLVELYRKEIGTLPPTLREPGPESNRELEKTLIAEIEISDTDLRQLAKRRAEAVESYLLQEGGIDPKRLFVVASAIRDPESEGTVPVVMSLIPR
ncbi:hypothetical protein D3OALGB2SA_86 [Olavius algarvensis associated proteobacterium Delta 3]|nr:hypothetical protein D3OALGB2SA_86 [Olavius algarvensis associated proteobacterium Delta 3]